MNMNLQTFNFENQQVRTIEFENEPWFVANDVTTILGLSNTTVALQRLDEDERAKYNLGRQGMTNIVNEYGLYNLVLASRKPEAKQFKRWITHEVLPTIRKHGAYLTDKKAYDITHNPNSLADLLLQAGEQLKQKELIIKEMQPKALFADAVTASHTSILVGDLAKLIKQNGYDIGQNRLFKWLKQNGYLIKSGERKNMPTQKSMEMGLFEVKERTIANPDGSIRITKTPKVTGKGQVYFINKFVKGGFNDKTTDTETTN